jgi:hypothetical protein
MKTQSESIRKFRMSVWERRNAARPTAGMALRSEALKKADRSFAYSPMARVLVWVVLLGAAARLAHGLICAPGVHPDTPDYVELARRIAAVNFAGWDGWRTPVFPLLLLLCRFDFSAVRLVQSLLGIATAAMISVLIFQRTGSSRLALLGGLAYAFDLGQISFESLVMTGALCTFLVVASVLIFARIVLAHPGGRAAGAGWHVLLGFVAGAAALTRPLFLFLAPLYLIALLSIAASGHAPRTQQGAGRSCGARIGFDFWLVPVQLVHGRLPRPDEHHGLHTKLSKRTVHQPGPGQIRRDSRTLHPRHETGNRSHRQVWR